MLIIWSSCVCGQVVRTEHFDADAAELYRALGLPPAPTVHALSNYPRAHDTRLSALGRASLTAQLQDEYHVLNAVLLLANKTLYAIASKGVSDGDGDHGGRHMLATGLLAFVEGRATLQPATVRRRAAWLHLPKCGSSFGTTLAHWLDVHETLPATAAMGNMTMLDDEQGVAFAHRYPYFGWAGPAPLRVWIKCRRLQKRPDGTLQVVEPPVRSQTEVFSDAQLERLQAQYGCSWAQHVAASPEVHSAFAGNWMGFFRETKRRTVSAYRDFGALTGVRAGVNGWNRSTLNITEYAHLSAGAITKQLAGQAGGHSCNVCVRKRAVTDGEQPCRMPDVPCDQSIVPDVAEALRRLDAFAFIGNTDEWATSVCLFHAKLGGPCRAVEGLNSRPTESESADEAHADTRALLAALADFEDPFDTVVNNEALRRYRADLRVFNVTPARCRALCPSLASQFHG